MKTEIKHPARHQQIQGKNNLLISQLVSNRATISYISIIYHAFKYILYNILDINSKKKNYPFHGLQT